VRQPYTHWWACLGAIAAAVGLGVVSACGSESEDQKLREALAAITDGQLAIMVLPQEAVGEDFEAFEVDPGSGPQDNSSAAEDTIDPHDDAAAIEEAGREEGYELSFDAGFEALSAGEGIFSVSSSVDLFDADSSAAAYIADQADDYRRLVGQELEPSVTLTEAEQFDVRGLADEALGIEIAVSFNETTIYGTFVGFRLGRLLGSAGFATADNADSRAPSEELARALHPRIRGVLLGDVQETPVPVPPPEEEEPSGGTAEAPDSAPFPDAMALTVDDLGEGASVVREEYIADPDTVATYEREFDVERVQIGASNLLGLENDVDLYESELEASGIFAAIQSVFTGPDAADIISPFFEEGAGFEATDIAVRELAFPQVGNASFAVSAEYGTPAGPFTNLFLYIRVGRATAVLIVTAQSTQLAAEDMTPLMARLAERMDAELSRSP
jgi:hypothetical protein